jgi:EAL domain-containing protein (putative c-di-GMP-specific phosphodiesterase class I)
VAANSQADALVADIIARRDVRTVFQPLVHVASLEVVGFEALTRGPEGSPLESPVDLISAATRAGRLEELDWVCAATAARTALAARLHPSLTFFLNLEPSTLDSACPADLVPGVVRAREDLRVVVEMGERSLLEDPAGLLGSVASVRADGWGVAVDRVGGDHSALAMLPFVQPDVIKVSLPLLRSASKKDWAETANTVRAYSERTGAVTLVQGVETDNDAMLARTFGATYAQGWRYGRPEPLPAVVKAPHEPFPLLQRPETARPPTPFELISARCEPKVDEKRVLVQVSKYLEDQAINEAPVVVLACLENAEFLAGETLARYGRIGSRAVLTAALAVGLSADRVPPGVMATRLSPWDRLSQEWDVLVLGPHFNGALGAGPRADGSTGAFRRFEYVVTHDRELVVLAARALAHRTVAKSWEDEP